MRRAGFLVVILAALFGVTGCATPGPLHVYATASAQPAEITDLGGEQGPGKVPAFVEAGDEVTGMAYDPFTDHFFLRLAPGNRFLVVDRPARSVKRRFTVTAMPTTGGGDLAIRPKTGHVYLLRPGDAALDEITRLGDWVRVIRLDPAPALPAAIAYDSIRDRLLVLFGTNQVVPYTLAGRQAGEPIRLQQPVGPSLGFDPERREYYAPLTGSDSRIGVFGEDGRLQRTLDQDAASVDVGPRSFLRMF